MFQNIYTFNKPSLYCISPLYDKYDTVLSEQNRIEILSGEP